MTRLNVGFHGDTQLTDSTQPLQKEQAANVSMIAPGVVVIHPRPLDDAPRVHNLAREVTIGRSRDVTVLLNDPYVSRSHAYLSVTTSGFSVSDLDSQHGTFLNGERVGLSPQPAPFGSVLRLGDTLLLLTRDCEPYRSRPRRLGGETLGLPRPLVAGPALCRTWDEAVRVAAFSEPLLIMGESGAGKECIARLVHQAKRPRGPFLGLNLAAVPDTLFEAELFGYERGAFTGAVTAHIGAFREASGGVLFLDEVADLRQDLQAKLLRAIDLQVIRPLGGRHDVATEVRIVAATSQDLVAAVGQGRFRADLYYRLAGIVLRVPPLRERPDDVILLATAILHELSSSHTLSGKAAEALVLRTWEGNARALRHAMVHALAQANAASSIKILAEHLPAEGAAREPQLSAERIAGAMSATGGVASRAAEMLQVSRSAFYKACKRLSIEPGTLRE